MSDAATIVARLAVLALLAAVLSPAEGRRRLHRAAGGSRRRRQPAAVPVVAGAAAPAPLGGRRRGAGSEDRALARCHRDPAARRAARARSRRRRWSRPRPRKPSATASRRWSSKPSGCSRRRCSRWRRSATEGVRSGRCGARQCRRLRSRCCAVRFPPDATETLARGVCGDAARSDPDAQFLARN